MTEVTIRYHGHACFTLESQGYRTVLDPYAEGMVPGLPALSLEAEAVLCSHEHGDHAYVQAVTVKESVQDSPYTLESIETDHDDQGGSLRGKNLIRIFRFNDLTVAHLGDLGHVPSAEVLEKLKGIDCMMIPVGGFYTIDPDTAEKIVNAVQPRVTVPMHYRTDTTGFPVLAHLNTFTNKFEQVQTCINSFTLTGEEETQIKVIDYKP